LCDEVKDYAAKPDIREPVPELRDRYGSEPTTLQRLLSTFGVIDS